MKVSIITATNNSEKTIEDCIKSLIAQVYVNVEFIIIDNNSTDSTLAIIEKYQLKNKSIKLVVLVKSTNEKRLLRNPSTPQDPRVTTRLRSNDSAPLGGDTVAWPFW